jgi:hypothetical protein
MNNIKSTKNHEVINLLKSFGGCTNLYDLLANKETTINRPFISYIISLHIFSKALNKDKS